MTKNALKTLTLLKDIKFEDFLNLNTALNKVIGSIIDADEFDKQL